MEQIGDSVERILRDLEDKLIKRRTRQFVRRQANWFKEADPNIHWFTVEPHAVTEIEQLIRARLSQTS